MSSCINIEMTIEIMRVGEGGKLENKGCRGDGCQGG